MVTVPRELSPADTETYLQAKSQARALDFLRDFTKRNLTPSMLRACDLYADYQNGIINQEQAHKDLTTLTPEEFKETWGIATDFPELSQLIEQNIGPLPPNDEKWSHEVPIKSIEGLLQVGENINLETLLIKAVHTLATMDVYDGQSDKVYEAIAQAESIFAPLCEIIGYDGPAMALRSKALSIRLRNCGLGHFVNESERLSLMYQDERGDYGPRFHYFASRILQETTGSSNLKSVIGSDSKHGIVLEEGFNDERGLREIARLKTIGARANKLFQSTLEYKDDAGETDVTNWAAVADEVSEEDKYLMKVNMDDVGVTVVAKDDAHLIASYIDAARAMLSSEHITPWPSPRRREPFHIRGSKEFVDQLKVALAEHFDLNDFEFKPDDSGFHVAKMTGYYEDNMGCVPFEVQFLTQEGRKDSRVGKAAHIFYKIMRALGHKFTPTKDEINRTAKLNTRREHIGSGGLCPPSEQRYADFVNDLAA